jgi:hypothetical protein
LSPFWLPQSLLLKRVYADIYCMRHFTLEGKVTSVKASSHPFSQ